LLDRTDAHMNDLVSGCGYSKNANHASGGGQIGTLPLPSRAEATDFVAEVPVHAHAHVAHNARFSSADEGGDESWNITTCRDMLLNLTSDNTRVCTTESSFGKSYQRPSNDLANVRNIPSIVTANMPMHEDISSGCPRDRSDNVVTNSTVHCSMGVSRENAVILPSRLPGTKSMVTVC
jgi:hypothetical protein